MITLITGAPGAGKTLLAVAEFLVDAEKNGRAIVVDGIPDLSVTHEPAPPVADWTQHVDDSSSQDGKKLLFTFGQGSLVVIDEAQRVYRPRGVGSRVPLEVAAFETHRHQGLDFVLLTQHPNLIDANVRKLVGRHIHIRDLGILGRKVYEWPEVADPSRFRDAPIQRSYKMRKEAFSLYKSASLHVKPQRGIPKGFVLLAFAVPLLAFMVLRGYTSISSKVLPSVAQTAAVPVSAAAPLVSPSVAGGVVVDRDELLVEFIPRVSGQPETAPGYDPLRIVKNMPVVAGCVQTSTKCSCQTQSGVDAGLDRFQCLAWIKNPPFDPYRDAPIVERPTGASEARLAATAGNGGAASAVTPDGAMDTMQSKGTNRAS